MYVFANCITLVAIRSTVDINNLLAGSRRIGILSVEFNKFIISHSIRMEEREYITQRVIMEERMNSDKRI